MTFGVASWIDHGPSVYAAGVGRCWRFGDDLEVLDSIDFSGTCHGVIDLGCASSFLVAYVSKQPAPFGTDAVAVSAKGEELWRFAPAEAVSLRVGAGLHGQNGLLGIAFAAGDNEGIVGIGIGGRRLWDLPGHRVVYELAAHPSLPGLMLAVGGDIALIEYDRTVATIALELDLVGPLDLLYAVDGLLLRANGDDRLMLIAAEDPLGDGHILCLDLSGEQRWRLRLDSRVHGLALLHRGGGGDAFAVALDDGHLLLVSHNGTLLQETAIPGSRTGDGAYIRRFEGGAVADDSWVLVIDSTCGAFSYEVCLSTPSGELGGPR